MKHVIYLFTVFSSVWGFPNFAVVPQLDGRIVGGEAVTIEEYPYQASLLYWNRHFCGGSLISDSWVISAAHCTQGSVTSILALRSGSSNHDSGGTVSKFSLIKVHPRYNSRTIDYDISVLRLTQPLLLANSVGIVNLPIENQIVSPGTSTVVTGWGATTQGGSIASQLQAVRVPIVSKDDCSAAYGSDLITDRMLCAGYLSGGKDSCQGDSGGPLVSDGTLFGIVSWGHGCAVPRYPGVYSSVSNLRSFVTEVCGL